MSSFQVPAVFKAIDRITSPIRNMERGVTGFANRSRVAIARVDRQFNRLRGSIIRAAGGFGLFLGAAAAFSIISGGVGVIADYEQANANLASVLGKTVQETAALQQSSQRLGATTSFTASQVAGLQTEYAKLGFLENEILGATEATLSLAAATNTELPQAAKQVGAAIRAFGLQAAESARVADVFAASTSKSALDMEKLDVAMSKVAPVAKQFGFSIEDTTALLGTLANAGFDASTMATSTRSILLNLADAGGKLAVKLGKPARTFEAVMAGMSKLRKEGVSLGEMLGATDKRSVAAFATLLDGSKKTEELQQALKTAKGTAQEMAEKQLDTLRGSITKLTSAYQGLLISQNNNNSGFLKSFRLIIDVTTEVLSLASGMAKATEALSDKEKMIRKYANITITAIKVIKNLFLGYVSLKAIVFTITAAYRVYSIAVGINTALNGKSLFALRANTIAMRAHAVTTKAVTAATRVFNLVLMANPIGVIITAIGVLSFMVFQMVNHWDSWGAAMSVALGPLGLLVSAIMSFRRNWEMIKGAFTNGGFLNGIAAIGFAITDSILQPIEQLLQLVKKFTGLDLGLSTIGNLRDFTGSSLETLSGRQIAETPESVNPDATKEEGSIRREERKEEKNVKIEIADSSGKANVGASSGIDISFEPTFGRLSTN